MFSKEWLKIKLSVNQTIEMDSYIMSLVFELIFVGKSKLFQNSNNVMKRENF